MYRVWGWLTNLNEQDAGLSIVNRMGGMVEPADNSFPDLAISSNLDKNCLCESSGVRAALIGKPNWDDKDLTEISREMGVAAALLEAWRRYGINLLTHLHGPFSLAVLDTKSDTVLLAIDRAGIHSLCFATTGNTCIFGSTADMVAAHPSVGKTLDNQAIFNYLYFHIVPAPGSIYRNIFKMMPGEYVLYSAGKTTRKFYWRMPYKNNDRISFDNQARQFHKLLRESVERSIEGAASPGSFLSGGTDSSTICGMLAHARKKSTDSYSIGFDVEGFDEIRYARIASRHFNTHAHEYYVTPNDVLDAIPMIAAAYDEPFGNASAVPTYYCAKLASEDGIDVMLAGDGGDEIFGGNARYAKQRIFEIYEDIPGAIRRYVLEPFAFKLPGATYFSPTRKLRSYINQAKIPLPQRMESYNFLILNLLTDIFEPDFVSQIDTQRPQALMMDPYDRTDSSSYINRMMHLDLKQTLADNDLRKVNRMCELAGIEVRYPMLDDDLMEFSAQLPDDWKVKGAQLRYFFKKALRDFLPREILTKSKHGFGLPFGLWMKKPGPLRDLALDSLGSFRRRGYMQSNFINGLIEQHRTADASYYGVMIWVIMMLEQWLQVNSV